MVQLCKADLAPAGLLSVLRRHLGGKGSGVEKLRLTHSTISPRMEVLSDTASYVDLMIRGRSRVIATAVIKSPDGVALVDPGPSSCLATLRAALSDAGVAVADFFDGGSGVAYVGDVAGVRTGKELFVMPPTPPPDINIEVWKESVALIRQWQASTLFVTHYGAHKDPEAHLDVLEKHLAAMKEMARDCILEGGDDRVRQQRFVDRMVTYLERHIPQNEAGLYGTAAPIDQCWLGLVRYWQKYGELE